MSFTPGASVQEPGSPQEPPTHRRQIPSDILCDRASFQTKGRHISAPFDLRHDFDSLSMEPANLAFFEETFPKNKGYTHDSLFLYIHLSKPPQPIPKSFAGVPVLFAPTVDGPIPFAPSLVIPRGHWVPGRQGQIATHLNYRDKKDSAWEPLFEEIRAHFQSLAIPITEVIYFGYFVYIVLADQGTDMTKLPCRAAEITCMYMFEHEMQRPTPLHVRPGTEDAGHDAAVDDSNYKTLQPGVKVCSDFVLDSQASLSTTLGARVCDQDGNHYITISADGFFDRIGAEVFHPSREHGRLVGHMTKRIGNTGVGLLSLCRGESYVNESFASTDSNAPSHVTGLRSAKQFDVVAMDSPYTGYFEGHVMATSRRRNRDDDGADKQQWAEADWIFKSPGSSEQLPDGVCGSIAYDISDYKVLSFFQCEIKEGPWKGWCVGTSATELLKRGYT
ncbi:hypothetical protein F503_02616 [Ophiostoma piceae UAMH 11346]|uniref:Uncharacterized protein n=1 Tax=Ophiostoma piceae (strain UAMH 11346) TaxID=1262450 RepID=S3CJ83_OPHP1|nr:hypothetical protein F503_02616 [Ophiostoma piceae UAMH 11346]